MKEYSINCTGDACVDDEVRFERAVFTGSYPNAKFSHNEVVEGKIIRDSYGAAKQQHTFTIELDDGTTTRIKGRNLYRNGVWRKPWDDESERAKSLEDKHNRGAAARSAARVRNADSLGLYNDLNY